jgi:hypothetical protein
MTESNVNQLRNRLRQFAFDIHVYLGRGHLEKVYETALIHRLRKVDMVGCTARAAVSVSFRVG